MLASIKGKERLVHSMHCYILVFAVAHKGLDINWLHRFLYGCLLILTNWMHNKKLKCALYNISWHLSYCYETKVCTAMAASFIQPRGVMYSWYNCIYYRKNKLVASLCVLAQVCVSLPSASLHLCFLVCLLHASFVCACAGMFMYASIHSYLSCWCIIETVIIIPWRIL